MEDRYLYNKIQAFYLDGIELINNSLVFLGNDVPRRVVENFRVINDHSVSQEQNLKLDWSRLVIQHEDKLQKLKSYQAAVSALNNHPIIGKQLNTLIGTDHSMCRLETGELLRIILTSLIIESDKAVFNEDQLKMLYEKIENFFYVDVFRYRYFAPISNFFMELDSLELGTNFRIIKISKEEKERFLATSNSFHSTYSILAFKQYAFEFLIDQPKVIGEGMAPIGKNISSDVARSLFNKACRAFRLYKEGVVGFNYIWAINQEWDFNGIISFFTLGSTDFLGNKMEILNQDIPIFLDLWKKYQTVDNKNQNNIINAISRLSYGAERLRAEDQIVDYFVGLESLFLADNNPELKYRLALWTAHWVGDNIHERQRIYQIISKGYDQRSKIVHGGKADEDIKINGQKIPISEHAKLVGIYLRQAVKKFVVECSDGSKSEGQLLEELKNKILE